MNLLEFVDLIINYLKNGRAGRGFNRGYTGVLI